MAPPSIHIALAPTGATNIDVLRALTLDPYQSRVSSHPIVLTNPRTHRSAVLGEYVENLDAGSRFGIETTDGIVFVSRLLTGNSTFIFKAMKAISKADFAAMLI